MPISEIVVPQMGEGLREVRIVSFSKQPGERVRRDEGIYTMETDKALVEVESPFDGVLVEWLAKADDVLEIGTPVARIDTDTAAVVDTAPTMAAAQNESAHATRVEAVIPPRTRKYCKDLGIGDAEMRSIPSLSGKLMPADVDAYVSSRASDQSTPADLTTAAGGDGIERELSKQQRLFNYRARRSVQMVIPVTLGRPVAWSALTALAADKSAAGDENHVTEFQAFAYFAARSAGKFPKFRSVILSDDRVREYPHVNLGIAVARENGDLLAALVPAADSLPFDEFVATLRERVHQAREGHDQASQDMQFVLTYLGRYGITHGAPMLMSPAVGILFVGAIVTIDHVATVNIALTFDHRLINGAEAAEFLADLANEVEAATV